MRVAVMGTGHVGLVTCVALAEIGHDVAGTDVDAEKIDLLSRGVPPFYEPGLEEALRRGMRAGRLRFTPDPAEALRDAEVVFICVGTPPRADGEANLLAVERSGSTIARHGRDGAIVVEKSTVPAGTADRLAEILRREGGGRRFEVASNPEFLREGSALRDALEPDRIVIGIGSARSLRTLARLYEPLTREGHPLIVTDIRTAELAKHASNAFLAMKISFANALARLCERAGADVAAVADVMGADPRIGRAFLDAGLGYGGYCFPKDVAALERLARRLGYGFPLLREVARLNDEAVEAAVEKIADALWHLEGKRIAILGLSFKPETDDVRLSPALTLADRLLAAGAEVVGFDPRAGRNAKEELPALRVAADPYEAAAGAHCLVIATAWREFRDLDLVALRACMAYPVVVDGRNLLDPEAVVAAGFTYYPTGRPPLRPEAPAPPRPAAEPVRAGPLGLSTG
ncbi:MAG TPA: UDP-glucose/GDP-mannose dehydrogenase family protein [Actinomycetota bacterium]|nr:UDP-glucose/GDP-mannose dehydrogenase family protein [Actinomycetota bacterium]